MKSNQDSLLEASVIAFGHTKKCCKENWKFDPYGCRGCCVLHWNIFFNILF